MNLLTFIKFWIKDNDIIIDNFMDDFSINLKDITKWMSFSKNNLKETLINSYKENIDYKIIKRCNENTNITSKDIILLTPECLKLMIKNNLNN